MPKHYLRNPARKLVNCEQSESIDNALRRFKRKVQTQDIIKEVKPHSFYLKPDAKRQALLVAKACSKEDSQGVVSGRRTDIAHHRADRNTLLRCGTPVDLGIDPCADENGKAVHAECSVPQVTSSSSNPAAAVIAN